MKSAPHPPKPGPKSQGRAPLPPQLVKNRARVLVIDDDTSNQERIRAYLKPLGCELVLADSGQLGLDVVSDTACDLVLVDVQMSGLDGYEICRRIKARPYGALVPVVMLTALNQTKDRVKALDAGADDFLSKPVERNELIARVASALRLKAVYDSLDNTEHVIFALAAAVEAKDSYTEKHTRRVAETARRIGVTLGLPDDELDLLFRAGLVHDVGKIGVPDSILGKPGPLGQREREVMNRHTLIGEDIVRPLRIGSRIGPIIRHHHERVDGDGYPDRLAGDEIPLLARIVAVCDAHDALVSTRPYRPGLPAADAAAVLRAGAGCQWDAELVPLALDVMTW